MATIETKTCSVSTAFSERFYVVPDYQREYVWKDREVLELLEDINEQVQVTSIHDYFVGTVLVAPVDGSSSVGAIVEVIDGQQRLTTFFLLLCALRWRFEGEPQSQMLDSLIMSRYSGRDGNVVSTLKLDPQYEGAAEILRLLATQHPGPDQIRAKVKAAGLALYGSTEKLVQAYETICSFLAANYESTDSLRRFWGYLANSVIFIQIKTDLSHALKIFETINERGVGLNPMDLLKNLLFINVPTKQFTLLRNEWKLVTKPLEKAKQKPLRFLRYFVMATYPVRGNDGVVREDEIYDWFTDKNNAALCGYRDDPFGFVRKLTRSVEQYLHFINGLDAGGQTSNAMQSIKSMCGGGFSLHYVLLLAAAPLPAPLFDHFVRQLEAFLFYFIFTKSHTRDLERLFSQWADRMREIVAIPDAEAQKRGLNDFVASCFAENMAAKAPELADALRRATLYSMQLYRIRYLLARLTQHVDMAYRGQHAPGSLADYMGLEIEHILPNTPTADLRESFEQQSPGADYDQYKIKIGNLTLIEKPINIVAGRDYYADKRPLYKVSRHYLTSSLAELSNVGVSTSISRINERLSSFDDWTAKTIDERQAMLHELARDCWRCTSLV